MTHKPLLILDLNGNLLLSQHKKIVGIKEDGRANVKYLYFRPYMRKFLEWAFEHFYVAVWTSNAKHNAVATVDAIFTQDQLKKLHFLWSREKCLLGPNFTSKKPIDLLFGQYNFDEITIIDDSPEKIVGIKHENNYVQIKSYDRPNVHDTELIELSRTLQKMYNLPSSMPVFFAIP